METLFKKNIVLFGLVLSIVFLFIAGYHYPGGSPKDINSIGYSFKENYISNLLEFKAVNGMENKARPFGVIGVILLGLSSGLAFVRLSKKVDSNKYLVVIKNVGIILIILSSLISIPSLHDTMVTLSSIATLLLFFYVTVLLIKSKLLLLKFSSIFLLLVSYGAAYMYFFRAGLDYLPIVQKTIHILQIILILGLEYLTTRKDFEHIKN
ncbi:MAG: hypothetical protein IPO92_13355 [Saprospiraceae bacterium]|nr:hypothetical protein [Saprospiraceae bacterium]